ncbi:MAG TPA: M48 family metalloprotease [bacterium]|nr:M48 family metalloprotease [bacterium]
MKKRTLAFCVTVLATASLLWSASCVNLFSVEDDENLGAQVDDEIQSNPGEYPLLKESDYPDAYDFLYDMRDQILDSGKVDHADDFPWQIKIIDDDSVLNAFSVPGGYLYFYTGLLKYLDTADHLAGVMGHEIAHAAKRHVTEALTQQYGIELLLQAALGNDLAIVQDIAGGLSGLAFSRDHESEADEFSVIYLAETDFACDGTAGFFEKLIAEGEAGGTPEFLSTHPNPENRVEDIHKKADELGCDTTPSGVNYDAFKASLP